jgi:hypothetical protein
LEGVLRNGNDLTVSDVTSSRQGYSVRRKNLDAELGWGFGEDLAGSSAGRPMFLECDCFVGHGGVCVMGAKASESRFLGVPPFCSISKFSKVGSFEAFLERRRCRCCLCRRQSGCGGDLGAVGYQGAFKWRKRHFFQCQNSGTQSWIAWSYRRRRSIYMPPISRRCSAQSIRESSSSAKASPETRGRLQSTDPSYWLAISTSCCGNSANLSTGQCAPERRLTLPLSLRSREEAPTQIS